MTIHSGDCMHNQVACLNPYEIIRKYRCLSCGAVMMCACEEQFALQFLPHQIREGSELETGKRVSITGGFIKGICNACREIPEIAFPKAEIYGCTSKVKRYYWREIQCETIRRFGAWAKENGDTDWIKAQFKYKEKYKEIEKIVIEEIKKTHAASPKYQYTEQSDADILSEHNVELVSLGAKFAYNGKKLQAVTDEGMVSPEEFVARFYQHQGYSTLLTESIPFHVLFGTFTWLLIEDPLDPLSRTVSFGDRCAYEQKIPGKMVYINMPEDFGRESYYIRRKTEIAGHFSTLVPHTSELLWLFDYWIDRSQSLRQYLWAHRPVDIAVARQLVQILPPAIILRILDYLLKGYWDNYCGWPDMLIYKGQDFFFAEVKASKDKLRENQKDWIRNNSAILKLPFKIVKIHNKTMS